MLSTVQTLYRVVCKVMLAGLEVPGMTTGI